MQAGESESPTPDRLRSRERLVLLVGSDRQEFHALARQLMQRAATGSRFTLRHLPMEHVGAEAAKADALLIGLRSRDEAKAFLESFRVQPRVGPPPVIFVLSEQEDRWHLEDLDGHEVLKLDELSPPLLVRTIIHGIERRRLRHALDQHNTHLVKVIESNADGMLVVDSHGIVRFVNPQAQKLLGRSREQLLGHDFGLPLVAAESTEIEVHRPDGSIGTVELRAVAIDWHGERAVLASLRDVTQRKEAQHRLTAYRDQLNRLATELSAAEQRERRRLATVLHDELQQLLVAAKLQANQAKLSRGTLEGSWLEQTLKLLDESIAIARSLTAELSPTILHDRGLLAALQWLARRMEDRYGLKVEVICEGSCPPLRDPLDDFLFQSVRELLFNITKHAGTDSAKLIIRPEGNDLTVTVVDHGKAFDQQDLPQMGGAAEGFGLFRIQQRLESMGGTMQVVSHPGDGTEITLRVPVTAVKETRRLDELAEGASQLWPRQEGIVRVMLADDHDMVRKGLASILQQQPGIEVVGQASNGRQAVQMARELRPDVVLMDVTMPDMNGIDATRQITSDGLHVRVIGLSMHPAADVAAALMAAGALDYVTKDSPPAQLIDAIRRAAEPAA